MFYISSRDEELFLCEKFAVLGQHSITVTDQSRNAFLVKISYFVEDLIF